MTVLIVIPAVLAAAVIVLIRHRFARRRSRINSLAHLAQGPYRKVGEKRRK